MQLTSNQQQHTSPLPKQQAAVLAFIEDQISAGNSFPSALEIAKHMGWKNASSAMSCIMSLVWRGKIRMVSREPCGRTWKYTWELVGSSK